MSTHTSWRSLAFAAGVVLGATSWLPQGAGAQGVSLSFSPSSIWTEWDEDLGFARTNLLGGSVGLGFGRYVGLQGYYLQSKGEGLFERSDASLFDLEQAGVRMSLALGSGTLTPLITGGGVVYGFEPEGGDRIRRLGVDVGGGFRANIGNALTGEVLVTQSFLRLESDELTSGVFSPEAALRQNLALTAALGLRLGSRSMGGVSDLDRAFAERYSSPLSNFALSVEPLAGRLEWADATGLPRQDMIGLRAGLDFGPFFALRGFHWWGTEDDFRTTTGMKAWGGEAQFNLGADRALTPFLVGGASRLTWASGDDVADAGLPENQVALIAGGGLDFNLGPWVRATVGVRDFILAGSDLTASPELGRVADPSELVHNWQVSAGLKFVVSGRGIRRADPRGESPIPMTPAVAEEPTASADSAARRPESLSLPVLERGEIVIRFGDTPQPPVNAAPAASADTAHTPDVNARLLAVLTRLTDRLDELEMASRQLPADTLGAETAAPAQPTPTAPARNQPVQAQAAAQQPQPAGLSDTAAVQTIPDELRALLLRMESRLAALEGGQQPTRPGAAGVADPADPVLAALARFDERLAAIEAGAANPVTTAVVPTASTVVVESAGAAGLHRRINELRSYAGLGAANESGASGPQFLLGVAADIGPLSPGSSLRLVPEFAVGVGGGGSLLFNAGLQYGLPSFTVKQRVEFSPLLGFGPALLKSDRFSARVTTMMGTGMRIFGVDGVEKANLLVAYQPTDIFGEGRFIIGIRRPR